VTRGIALSVLVVVMSFFTVLGSLDMFQDPGVLKGLLRREAVFRVPHQAAGEEVDECVVCRVIQNF
jgi:hypothetical protein